MRKLTYSAATALCGVAIAGLALASPASAATASGHTAASAASRVVPNINPDDCPIYTDGETYAETYCPYPPGSFRIGILCTEGIEKVWLYGLWEAAGGGVTSYERCPDNKFLYDAYVETSG
ncbi:MAG: hypothetical protein JO345_35920 [Streptosporangiaceae bacterium]|nr:hypothetical protein [Streptosporangiaceae bacterium]